jgi:Ran GTPase-activating protein (RanGAP) involved in mRNA processing and transport
LLYLNLRNNNISRHSYNSLRTILLKGNLRELNLADNHLTDDGIKELAELKNTQLAKLDLSNIGM